MAEPRLGGDVVAVVSLAGFLAVTGSLIGGTALGVMVTPIVYLCAVYAMIRVPLRYSIYSLMFLGLTLQNRTDGPAYYESPLTGIGDVLLTHINTIDRSVGVLSWMSFSGMDVCIATLWVVALLRRSSGSRLDSAGRTLVPRPLVKLAYLALGSIVFAWMYGLARGGIFRFSLWQVKAVIHLPVLFLLCNLALRGRRDLGALLKVILWAGVYKALLAVYIVWSYSGTPQAAEGKILAHATSHQDSILFAGAFVTAAALVLERAGRGTKWVSLAVMPILAAGMVANNRRLVWVQVALVLLTMFFASGESKTKRYIKMACALLLPVVAVYVAIGWESNSGAFKPVQMIRSVVDAKSDGSSMWREMEDYNLIGTIKTAPLFGTGFGHGYLELIVLPMIPYELERYVPHNSILGSWAFLGFCGFTALTLLWAGGAYYAMRSYYRSTVGGDRAAAMVCYGFLLVYLLQCWGDLGLGSWAGILTVAPAIAIAGKLAAGLDDRKGAARSPERAQARDSSPPRRPRPVRARSYGPA